MGPVLASAGSAARVVRTNSRRLVKNFSIKDKGQTHPSCQFSLRSPLAEKNELVRLEALCKSTTFSRKEIQILYRGFKEVCQDGLITAGEFKKIFLRWFPSAGVSNYAMHVFRTFDENKDGVINFKEFINGLALMSRSSTEDKLKWIFNLYDVDGDGTISFDDIEQIIESVYQIMGEHAWPPIYDVDIKTHAKDVFNKLNKNNDFEISSDEFVQKCLQDETIVESILSFDIVFSRS